ncbi:MAG: (Fe-S)-binding protein [Chloroflexota bacterium]
MADKLVSEYRGELAEPGCAPGMGRWGGLARLKSDISPVFPYLNASLPKCQYDHTNLVLIWRDDQQTYALRPLEIRVASVRDLEHARQVIGDVVELINRTWAKRNEITPDFSEKALPGVMAIFKPLPRTNCQACGYPTCLAFAADLRTGATTLERCSPLLGAGYASNLKTLRQLFTPD